MVQFVSSLNNFHLKAIRELKEMFELKKKISYQQTYIRSLPY